MAINPNELRIGNYVMAELEDWTITKVKGVNEYNIMCQIDSVPYEIEDVNPIRLTKEWLINFGFERKWDDYNGEIEQFEKSIITWSNGQFRVGSFWVSDFEINYVHQLQNLFF